MHPMIQLATSIALKKANLPSGSKYFLKRRPNGMDIVAFAIVVNILPHIKAARQA